MWDPVSPYVPLVCVNIQLKLKLKSSFRATPAPVPVDIHQLVYFSYSSSHVQLCSFQFTPERFGNVNLHARLFLFLRNKGMTSKQVLWTVMEPTNTENPLPNIVEIS